MSRSSYTGPKLPKVLLDRVQDGNGSKLGSKNGYNSRKDRRKDGRQQKKAQRQQPRPERGSPRIREDEDVSPPLPPQPAPRKPGKDVKPLKSILKKQKPATPPHSESESGSEEEPAIPVVSRAVKSRLEDDDAEIAALEKKLGRRGKKSSAVGAEGLDWLVAGSVDGSSDDEANARKRKRPEDAKWLRDKRLKASHQDSEGDVAEGDDGNDEHDLANPFSEDETDGEEYDGFVSDDGPEMDHDAPPLRTQRENPYVAPVSKDAAQTTKYIPPSLRKPATSDEEVLRQLRRQMQGLLNRLSEANLLSILQSLEELYSKNARQHVTSTLVDLLVGLTADASTLSDTFLLLHAGFAAAVYKVVGTDFGAQLLEKMVESFDHHRSTKLDGKQSLNLIAFLACLYTFQMVGSAIVFDYVRHFLEELSESNTELLLRIVRTSGRQLRQDDPSALKDIVLLLHRFVAVADQDQLSVRTKFMIETINDLKNNRMKTGVAASAIATEHTTRMKKIIGSLNQSRAVKAKEPLRLTLADIKDSEKKGKWWLVGASFHDPAKLGDANGTSNTATTRHDAEDPGYESETPGSVNLSKLTRSQGMNTDVRRAIFITTLSSVDYKHAHIRLLKLNLKNKQMLELPRVLVHCVGMEQSYNPFYALVARKFCTDHRLRKAFQFVLWDALKQMDVEDDDEEGEEREGMSMRKLVSVAKFYGDLIGDGGLSIAILKKVEFGFMGGQTAMFVEVLLSAVFEQVRKKGKEMAQVKEVFSGAAGAANIAQGLRWFVENVVAKGELADGKRGKRAVRRGCEIAVEALDEAGQVAPVVEEEEEEDEDLLSSG